MHHSIVGELRKWWAVTIRDAERMVRWRPPPDAVGGV